MLVFALRRVLTAIPVLLLVMLGTFALIRGWGPNPFVPPEGYNAVPGPLQRKLAAFYHLHDPWLVEFGVYVKNVFTFHFGPSMVFRSLDVTDVITHGFPVTLTLVLLAAAWAVPIGIALGVLGALRRTTLTDVVTTSVASVVLVVPVFFTAFLFAKYLVADWHLFPSGWDTWRARILPSFTLALGPIGYIARLIRAAVVETLEEDYVVVARAKGLRERRVVVVHVLRNSLAPFLSAAVPMLALLIAGTLFVERFFGIPGMASYFLDGVKTGDYPVLLGVTVVTEVVVLAASLVSDLLLALADPRLRDGRG